MEEMEVKILIAVITFISTLVASSGFWAWVIKKDVVKNANTKMLLGLGHDRIVYLGLKYIERGSVTQDEYENLYKYLYQPYEEMGGNGSAKRIMETVSRLPIRVEKRYLQEEKK